MIIDNDGKKELVCFDTLEVNGWISAIMVPVEKILSSLPVIKYYTLYLSVILIVIAIIFALILSDRISKPLRELSTAINKVGEGNFDTKVYIQSNNEIGKLVHSFNEMNEKIRQLIEENYEVKIREKETQIMALNLQLNPHFLSNTLNTINWMAIENNQEEISKMIISLSTMLQYTMQNSKETVLFKDDLEWLKSYIYIMSNRSPGLFSVIYDFDPLLYGKQVPKLFLQPFIENSIIHGFEFMESGGIIRIKGVIENETRYFYVIDNGKGLTEEEIHNALNSDEKKIGISNVNKRIKLIYGERYGVKIKSQVGTGTEIEISMPL